MATVRKTITDTDQQDAWIKAQIDGGHYTNDSEYIRDLIRREQARSAAIDVIRQPWFTARVVASRVSLMLLLLSCVCSVLMAEYRLSPAAEQDLDVIWQYSYDQWG